MNKSKLMALVVDDNPWWLRMLVRLVSDADYVVLMANSYEEALRKISTNPPDLIVADLRLKDEDDSNIKGLLLIKGLKESGQLDSAIVVTGYPTSETRDMADNLGIAYFEKGNFNRVEFLKELQLQSVSNDMTEPTSLTKTQEILFKLARGLRCVDRALSRSRRSALELMP
jgi:ActR/RegA family two-component response regulator